jgi:hypothetical protein
MALFWPQIWFAIWFPHLTPCTLPKKESDEEDEMSVLQKKAS